MITNTQSNTRLDEIAGSIYRISTPWTSVPGGFSFNQYLIVDDQPLLFHSGPRGMFPLVREAVALVLEDYEANGDESVLVRRLTEE